MAGSNDYIRFDWAIKRILRDKANKGVLEDQSTDVKILQDGRCQREKGPENVS